MLCNLYVANFSREILFIILPIALIFITICFKKILTKYTEYGKRIQEDILGFKMFLSFTEKERLKFYAKKLNIGQAIEQFETFLPYAIALDVEKQWSDQFNSVFKDIEKDQNGAYVPYWYVGQFRSRSFSSKFGNSFSSSVTSAISSSNVKPGSSSGFGSRGGSGRGGGGGGGGSW